MLLQILQIISYAFLWKISLSSWGFSSRRKEMFFSISIYTPKVTKQKHMQQCPEDIF